MAYSQLLHVESFIKLKGDMVPDHNDGCPPDGPGLVYSHLNNIVKEFYQQSKLNFLSEAEICEIKFIKFERAAAY